jgi:hypothetical protein
MNYAAVMRRVERPGYSKDLANVLLEHLAYHYVPNYHDYVEPLRKKYNGIEG